MAQMHTDAIIAALQATIDDAGGIVSHVEAYPLPWTAEADLPAALYRFADFIDTPDTMTETCWTQTYQIDIFMACKYDKANTPAVGRAVAEAARNAIKADRTLGGGYLAHVRRVTAENELQAFFREENQPRQAFLLEVIVNKQEDES